MLISREAGIEIKSSGKDFKPSSEILLVQFATNSFEVS